MLLGDLHHRAIDPQLPGPRAELVPEAQGNFRHERQLGIEHGLPEERYDARLPWRWRHRTSQPPGASRTTIANATELHTSAVVYPKDEEILVRRNLPRGSRFAYKAQL